MRCFIGIPVTDSLADQCVTLSHSMGRATPIANLHLTLAFLGEQTQSALSQLHGSLTELAGENPPFQQLLNRCEPFPREQGPFMALTGAACPALKQLHHDLWLCLQGYGFSPEERPFRPHITLAKPGPTQTPFKAIGDWVLPVNTLVLYRSELGEPFPGYEPLARFPLLAGD